MYRVFLMTTNFGTEGHARMFLVRGTDQDDATIRLTAYLRRNGSRQDAIEVERVLPGVSLDEDVVPISD